MVKNKIQIWLKRYIPAEISAIIGALFFGLIVNTLFHNPILTAISGACGDNIGYYGTILFRDLRQKWKSHNKITFLIFIKTARNVIFEFGISESLDSFVVRPFAMYIFPLLLNNVTLGLIIGKFAADIIFYIPTIIAYELRSKHIKD